MSEHAQPAPGRPPNPASEPAHLAACKLLSYAEFYREQGMALPDGMDPEWAKVAGFMVCEPNCPSLLAAVARGRELAREFGW